MNHEFFSLDGPKTKAAVDSLEATFQETVKSGEVHTFNVLASFLISRGFFSLEQTIEKYWGHKFQKNIIPKMERIYAFLKKNKITEKNKREFNDMDDHVWMMPSKTTKVVCHSMQSSNLIYIWDRQFFSVRQFWNELSTVKGHYDLDRNEEFKKAVAENGINGALRFGNIGSYTDDVLGNPYPQKPSLNTFKKAKFKLDYYDCRDIGYLATYDFLQKKVDRAVKNIVFLEHLEDCDIQCLINELFEEEEEEELSQEEADSLANMKKIIRG
jgi:hypothetical protein